MRARSLLIWHDHSVIVVNNFLFLFCYLHTAVNAAVAIASKMKSFFPPLPTTGFNG